MNEQKEKYETPEIEVYSFDESDIITTSGVIELPMIPYSSNKIW